MTLTIFLAAALAHKRETISKFSRKRAVVFSIGFEFIGVGIKRGGEGFHVRSLADFSHGGGEKIKEERKLLKVVERKQSRPHYTK